MEKYTKPSQLYEWTLNNMSEMPIDEQGILLKNLEVLKWIPEMLQTLSPFRKEVFKLTMLKTIEDPQIPFCLMTTSCMLYNLRLHGVDVENLEIAINTSKRVLNELNSMFIENMSKDLG